MSLKDHRLGKALPSPKEKAKPKPKAKSEAKDAQDSAPVLPDKKKPRLRRGEGRLISPGILFLGGTM